MAKTKSGSAKPRRSKKNVQRGADLRTYRLADVTGRFAYRFDGFAMANNAMPFEVIGQGQFELDSRGALTGRHTSGMLRIEGQGSVPEFSKFKLEGKARLRPDGSGVAEIHFIPDIPGESDEFLADFEIVLAGSTDQIWLMGKGGKIVGTNEVMAELVTGEARRLP